MIKANCIQCHKEIMEQAALVLLVSEPDNSGNCDTAKLHICKKCKVFVFNFIKTTLEAGNKL